MGSKVGVLKIAAQKVGIPIEEYTSKTSSGLKWCSKGKHWKLRSEYHSDASRGDGLKAACKSCAYARSFKVPELTPESKAQQAAASNAVRTAVRQGLLNPVSKCLCNCGAPARHYHHYAGYDPENWLKVEPVCNPCHKKEHYVKI